MVRLRWVNLVGAIVRTDPGDANHQSYLRRLGFEYDETNDQFIREL